MALTQRNVGAKTTAGTEPRPSRRLLSRLSMGHVVMILVGLVALLLNLVLLRSGDDRVEVLIASVDLSAGEVLDLTDLETAQVGNLGGLASSFVSGDALASTTGSVLARPVNEGEVLRASDVRPPASSIGLREMSIQIAEAQAAGGRIARGDVVDVIAVVDGAAAYIASGLEVVAINEGGSGFGVDRDYFIVVAVDDETALSVAAAMRNGSIDIVRSTGAPPPGSES